jgi:hypothetical protein
MRDCPDCVTWFVKCPCCDERFCPDCGKLESEAGEEKEE